MLSSARSVLPKGTIQHPYNSDSRHVLVDFITPNTVGAFLAAFLALYPAVTRPKALQQIVDSVPGSSAARDLAHSLLLGLIGFVMGFLLVKVISIIRWHMLRMLLTYKGWIHGTKSYKTKVWALLIKLCRGPAPFPTFFFQPYLPKQPLPKLEDTLKSWLKVSKLFVTEEEHETTRELVEDFAKNEGLRAQAFLQEKYEKEENWIADYWQNVAYLSGRYPLAVNSNYYSVNKLSDDQKMDHITRATGTIQSHLLAREQLLNGLWKPILLNDLVPICMDGYRHVYGPVRIPGENIDKVQKYPTSTHIIVIRKGHYFKLQVYIKENGNQNYSAITPMELHKQLTKIVQSADILPTEAPIAALTTQDRTTWAKQRVILKEMNEDTLQDVESALFLVTLDDQEHKDLASHSKRVIMGSGSDRWFDKCFTAVIDQTGMRSGWNIEHTLVDGSFFCTISEHCFTMESIFYAEDGGIVKDNKQQRSLAPPERLMWNVEGLEKEIDTAYTSYQQTIQCFDLATLSTPFGKGKMKKFRVSPDGFIQMSLQLAYYRLHKETPKTYEPSSTRIFVLGRTENLHPESAESVAWVKSMDDPSKSKKERQKLLREAIKHQTKSRLEATVGNGCDRHLLALLCACREMGLETPRMFADKTWTLPFKLSTSQTPSRIYEYGADLDFDGCGGGFGPTAIDGYGLCYFIFGDDIINLCVTSWNIEESTNSSTFGKEVCRAFDEMADIFS